MDVTAVSTPTPDTAGQAVLSTPDLLSELRAEIAASNAEANEYGEVDETPFDFNKIGLGDEPATETPAETVQATEETKVEEPKPEPKETDASALNKLVQAQQRVQRLEAAELAAKKRADTAEAKAAELEAAFKKRTEGDIWAEFEARGMTFEELLRKVHKGEIEPPELSPKPKRDPEVEEMLAAHKAAKEAEARKTQQTQYEEVRQSDVAALKEHLGQPDIATAFPLLAANPEVADALVSHIYFAVEGKTPTAEEVATVTRKVLEAQETAMRSQLEVLLKSSYVRTLFEQSTQQSGKLGTDVDAIASTETTSADPSKTVSGDKGVGKGPTTLSNKVTAEVPSRSTNVRDLSDADFLAELNRLNKGVK